MGRLSEEYGIQGNQIQAAAGAAGKFLGILLFMAHKTHLFALDQTFAKVHPRLAAGSVQRQSLSNPTGHM